MWGRKYVLVGGGEMIWSEEGVSVAILCPRLGRGRKQGGSRRELVFVIEKEYLVCGVSDEDACLLMEALEVMDD
jgi:hypothetical protein